MKSGRGQQDGPKDVYFIQAGSFQNPADADNQKARLAILGFEVERRAGESSRQGHLVSRAPGAVQQARRDQPSRQALAQNNIDASLVKIKEQP